jgi:hypothetical protein
MQEEGHKFPKEATDGRVKVRWRGMRSVKNLLACIHIQDKQAKHLSVPHLFSFAARRRIKKDVAHAYKGWKISG